MDGGEVALQDGEVELGVCAGRRRCIAGMGYGSVGFIVGDGRDEVGGLAMMFLFSGCLATHFAVRRRRLSGDPVQFLKL